MNLTRKEIILYTGWYISLITIPSMLTLIHSWVPDLDIPLVSNWRNEISTLCYYSTNFLSGVVIFISQKRGNQSAFIIWPLAGLVLNLLGFILYCAWCAMDKSDLFMPESEEPTIF